jgi:cytochrome c-type biogenesis protein CcmE
MSRKSQRLLALMVGLGLLAAATALVLTAFSNNLVFFYTPSELRKLAVKPGTELRIGGLVELQSVKRDGLRVAFRVTDGRHDVPVTYRGVLPDLFREGQGVVVEGKFEPDGRFVAATVLAKHDARYMPRAVVAALKKSGHWRPGADMPDMTAARPLPHR